MNVFLKAKKYYPIYLDFHRKRWTRRFHLIGELFTILYLFYCIFNSYWLATLFTPFIIYIFAWPSHWIIERNKPATFKTNPLITKICDLMMCYHILIGKIKF